MLGGTAVVSAGGGGVPGAGGAATEADAFPVPFALAVTLFKRLNTPAS